MFVDGIPIGVNTDTADLNNFGCITTTFDYSRVGNGGEIQINGDQMHIRNLMIVARAPEFATTVKVGMITDSEGNFNWNFSSPNGYCYTALFQMVKQLLKAGVITKWNTSDAQTVQYFPGSTAMGYKTGPAPLSFSEGTDPGATKSHWDTLSLVQANNPDLQIGFQLGGQNDSPIISGSVAAYYPSSPTLQLLRYQNWVYEFIAAGLEKAAGQSGVARSSFG